MGNSLEDFLARAAVQGGAFSTIEPGVPPPIRYDLDRALAAGLLRREGRGLFTVAGAPRTWIQQLWLVQLRAGPESAIGRRAAGQLHRFVGCGGNHAHAVRRELGRSHESFGGSVHTTFWLPDHHIVTIDGLRVTSVARTLFDLAGDPWSPDGLRHPVRRAVHKQWVARMFNDCLAHHGLTMSQEVAVLAALGRRGVHGTTIIREIVHEFGLEYVPTESGLEDAVVDLIASAQMEQPERQVTLSDEQGWIGRVDFLYRRRRIVLEVDGPIHDTPLQRRIDRARDERLRAAGWAVIRIHWSELIDNPAAILRRLRESLAA